MKKYILTLVLACTSVIATNAQKLTVKSINGKTPNDFFNSEEAEFKVGETTYFEIDYTNMPAAPGSDESRITLRFYKPGSPAPGKFSNFTTKDVPSNLENTKTTIVEFTPTEEVIKETLQIFPSGLITDNFTNDNDLVNLFFNASVAPDDKVVDLSSLGIDQLLFTYYDKGTDTIIINDDLHGNFTIYNEANDIVMDGEISNEIIVESLPSGSYLLYTEEGMLDFKK